MAKAVGDIKNVQGDSGKNKIELLKMKTLIVGNKKKTSGDTFLVVQLVKKSACNAGDPGSIPGLGRSPEEGIGYPLQCSWSSPVAQLVKNLTAMW